MIVIGTAGHIDHGKTSLVGALTGIQTDRLREEQDRGISIELGFAYLDLAGTRCGIVDVPGHERFVRQMIAGATGIDLVILVVAADEGVMQQTREHLDICRLLGIRRGLVALTKVDLVDEEWLELVESDLEDQLEGSFLEGAQIVRFAAPDPATHEPLRAALGGLVTRVEAERTSEPAERPLRLPVDRVFTMKGFGTVVTGTVASGTLREGDSLEILPSGQRCRVRGVQSHGETVSSVRFGQRAAVNLQGVDKEAIKRGEVVCHAGSLAATRMLNLDLQLLAHLARPLETQAKALVHVGTAQVTGTVVLLDRTELSPGDTAPAQLRLDQFVVALGGDHVVLRGFELQESFGKTLGGGVIRHPLPRRARRDQADVLAAFEALRGDEPSLRVEHAMRLAGQAGVGASALHQIVNLSAGETRAATDALAADGRCFGYVEGGAHIFVHHEPFRELLERARERVTHYHERFAHRAGMPREELRSQIRSELPPRYFSAILDALIAAGTVEPVLDRVRRVGFVPTLTEALSQLKERVFRRYESAGLEPPSPADVRTELAEATGAKPADVAEMTDLLIAAGRLQRVLERLIFATAHIARLEEQVVDYLERHGEMTTPQLKELTGTTRKYTVPLGEHLDARKLTIRVGDVRRLRT